MFTFTRGTVFFMHYLDTAFVAKLFHMYLTLGSFSVQFALKVLIGVCLPSVSLVIVM